MKNRIIICGGNGAGKSTLGKALAEKTNWIFRDVEDYYFPKTDPDYLYAVQRTKEEVVELLYEDLRENDNLIFSSVRGDYSEQIAAMFTCAVFVNVPKGIRMERIRRRSYEKFGDRILHGGDLHEREKAFFDMVEKRSDQTVTDWLEALSIPVIEVDGTRTAEESVDIILTRLKELQ